MRREVAFFLLKKAGMSVTIWIHLATGYLNHEINQLESMVVLVLAGKLLAITQEKLQNITSYIDLTEHLRLVLKRFVRRLQTLGPFLVLTKNN